MCTEGMKTANNMNIDDNQYAFPNFTRKVCKRIVLFTPRRLQLKRENCRKNYKS